MHPRDQTIFALSSGRPPSAIAIVRVSGSQASTVLTRLAGKTPEALAQFEKAAQLDPRLAAARFQLYNMYRQAGRQADATKALA